MKILIIDDDASIVELIKKGLAAESFLVESAADGERGSFMARTGAYCLIILDNCLPKLSGTEVLKEIREEKIYTPIIMLTIKSEMEDKEIAFNLGADDYLTKPFLIEELLIRIKALLRRPAKIKTPNLRLGDLVLNTQSGIFKRQGKEIYLTKREFCLLQYFFKRKGEIISRGEILENVWDYNSDPLSNSIETHIASLRRKINFGSLPDLIHTFPGRDYKLALKKTT